MKRVVVKAKTMWMERSDWQETKPTFLEAQQIAFAQGVNPLSPKCRSVFDYDTNSYVFEQEE